jgi:hypothetical protein
VTCAVRRDRLVGASTGIAAAAALYAAAAPSAARAAELHDEIERVARGWERSAAAVFVAPTRFLNDDQTAAFILPDLPEGRCTTVLFLGSRGLGFHVTLDEAQEDESGHGHASEAGAVSIERCDQGAPHRILLTSDSGRGAIETIVARSEAPLPRLHAILPERTEGHAGVSPEPGALAAVPLPEKRADIAELRAARDGAAVLRRATWIAGLDGTGAGEDSLDPGCHTLTLFAVDPRSFRPQRRAHLDLDAELRNMADDRILTRDRSDAPDATLSVCVGETTRVGILFAGSPPAQPVLVSHTVWPLPEHLPLVWGTQAIARMGRVLLARHVSRLPSDPVLLAQGGAGSTSVAVPLEPGACYLAIVSLVQGVGRAIGLRAHVGAHDAADDRGLDDDGATVTFCAGTASTAALQVEARGTPLLGWGLAVYHLQSGQWELPW